MGAAPRIHAGMSVASVFFFLSLYLYLSVSLFLIPFLCLLSFPAACCGRYEC
jgi:hypothetical protein